MRLQTHSCMQAHAHTHKHTLMQASANISQELSQALALFLQHEVQTLSNFKIQARRMALYKYKKFHERLTQPTFLFDRFLILQIYQYYHYYFISRKNNSVQVEILHTFNCCMYLTSNFCIDVIFVTDYVQEAERERSLT